jgi:hypothetical protein
MKKPSRRVKGRKKKASAKKKISAKKKARAKKVSALSVVLGCCTITGVGPDVQYERITQSECERRAGAAGGNPQWIPGDCAEPS